MFPVVNHMDEFRKYPKLLDWYKTRVSPSIEDIKRMEMSHQPDGVHVWVYLHSKPDAVGYKVFGPLD